MAAQRDASGVKDRDLVEAQALSVELRQWSESLERERDEIRGKAAAQQNALAQKEHALETVRAALEAAERRQAEREAGGRVARAWRTFRRDRP